MLPTRLADAVGVDSALGHHEEAGGAHGAALAARLTRAEAAVLLVAAGPTGQQGAPHLVHTTQSHSQVRSARHVNGSTFVL